MRAYKFWSAAASLAVIAGCTGDPGKDGAAGAKGDKGDQGETGETGAAGAPGDKGDKGDKGDTGAAGEDGADAPCAANAKLDLLEVTGVDKPVFPGDKVTIGFDFAGTPEEVTYQWLGTWTSAAGELAFATPPAAGVDDNTFEVSIDEPGDLNYVVVATDGCSVVTANFTIKARFAQVGVVNVFPGETSLSFAEKGSTALLLGNAIPGFFGLDPYDDVAAGSSTLLYLTAPCLTAPDPTQIQTCIDGKTVEFDVYAGDADGQAFVASGSPLVTTAIEKLNPDDRVIVVAYADAQGKLATKIVRPDQTDIDEATVADLRVQLAHFAPGVGAVDIATTDDMSAPIFSDVPFASLSEGVMLPVADYQAFLDTNGDGSADFEIGIPLATGQALPGDYVLAFAWLDASGQLQVFATDTGGDGTQYAGVSFPIPCTTLPTLPDTAAAATLVNFWDDSGSLSLTKAGSKAILSATDGTSSSTSAAYGSSLPGFVQVAIGTTGYDVYPADDTSGTALASVTPPAAAQGDRTVVFAYSYAGDIDLAAVTPAFAPVADPSSIGVQFLHLASSFGNVTASFNEDLSDALADGAGFGDLSDVQEADLTSARVRLFADTDGDGAADTTLDLDPVNFFAGDHVILVAYEDYFGDLQVAAYTAFGEDPTAAPRFGLVIPVTVGVYAGPADIIVASSAATEFADYSTATISIPVSAPADCAVAAVTVEYTATAESPNYVSDMMFELAAPDGTSDTIGAGSLSGSGTESGIFEVNSGALVGVLADGEWTLTVTDTYEDATPAMNSIDSWKLSIVCGEVAGPADYTASSSPAASIADGVGFNAGADTTDTITSTETCTMSSVKLTVSISFVSDTDGSGESDVSDYAFDITSPDGTVVSGGGFSDWSGLACVGTACTAAATLNGVTDVAGEGADGTWSIAIHDGYETYATSGVLESWEIGVYCQ